jgi:4-diphosphocytidyl-2-C-methyl-D-erythritol kinase
MIVFPCAKINLGLNVLDRRKDGYHNIETLFIPLHNLTDVLEIVESQEFRFNLSGISLDSTADDNLCVKAYRMLSEDYPLPPVEINLHKVIPVGAGLGGGSSDAAFTLLTLDRMFDLHIFADDLVRYALRLGSDCPFFIDRVPSLAYGRGQCLEPIDINLSQYYILLVKPNISVSTSEAYRNVLVEIPVMPISEIIKLSIGEWRDHLKNSFETTVFAKYPIIARIKEAMYSHGAVYASMTGSGSAVYGLFSDKPDFESEYFNDAFIFAAALEY